MWPPTLFLRPPVKNTRLGSQISILQCSMIIGLSMPYYGINKITTELSETYVFLKITNLAT